MKSELFCQTMSIGARRQFLEKLSGKADCNLIK